MALKHDTAGFLFGEIIKTNDRLLTAQQDSVRVLSRIRTDVGGTVHRLVGPAVPLDDASWRTTRLHSGFGQRNAEARVGAADSTAAGSGHCDGSAFTMLSITGRGTFHGPCSTHVRSVTGYVPEYRLPVFDFKRRGGIVTKCRPLSYQASQRRITPHLHSRGAMFALLKRIFGKAEKVKKGAAQVRRGVSDTANVRKFAQAGRKAAARAAKRRG